MDVCLDLNDLELSRQMARRSICDSEESDIPMDAKSSYSVERSEFTPYKILASEEIANIAKRLMKIKYFNSNLIFMNVLEIN